MSYEICCDFYVNKKYLRSSILSQLKNINRTRYDVDFDEEVETICVDGIEVLGDRENGHWYNALSFAKARDSYRVQRDEILKKIINLENIKNTIDYFKLTNEQKEDLENSLTDYKDMLETYEYKISTCIQMTGILDAIENEFDSLDDDFVSKEVIVFIYAV